MALFDGLKGIIFAADDCQAKKRKRWGERGKGEERSGGRVEG